MNWCPRFNSLARKMQRRPAEILRRSSQNGEAQQEERDAILEKFGPVADSPKPQRAIAAIRAP